MGLRLNSGQVSIAEATSEGVYLEGHVYKIKEMFGMNAEVLYLTNDSTTGNIYAMLSSDGVKALDREILVQPGEVVELYDCNWVKIRTDVGGTKYRLSGYRVIKK